MNESSTKCPKCEGKGLTHTFSAYSTVATGLCLCCHGTGLRGSILTGYIPPQSQLTPSAACFVDEYYAAVGRAS